MLRRLLPAMALLTAVPPVSISAQDVEMLGRRYGTRPPAAYYAEMGRNPAAFRFDRGRAARMREARVFRSLGPAGVGGGGPALGLGPRGEAVVGNFSVPVLLGLFNDSPASPPVLRNDVQLAYFGPQAGTVSHYYAEISNDSITLAGDVRDWVRSPMDSAAVAQGISGLGCCGIGSYIKSLLDLQSPALNWGAYDNDGPDGVPNSGDDDGYVDALAVIHPKAGAECPGSHPNRIWSHKWSLTFASSDGAYVTATPSNKADVDFIRIDDYFVQGALRCGSAGLNDIGVFSHELGHAFGLPDLYDTRSVGPTHDGAGRWDLMAFGTWGCSGTTPYRPCHMGAWSKAMLGWVTVDTLPPDTDLGTLTLPPVETSGVVYRVDAGDGSDEYFLLENRQSLDPPTWYDQALPAEGLLIWQIDAGVVRERWPENTVNAFDHMGVWLRQADGLDELGQVGGIQDDSDSGDPFPGLTLNTAFHAASNPAARSFEGTPTGLTVLDITKVGDNVDLRILTRFTALTVTSSGTTPGASGLFTVDGMTVPDPPGNFALSAPFLPRTIEAAPGDSVQPGERTPFFQWDDSPAPRARVVVTPLSDTTFNATYSGTQYQLRVDMTGGRNGVQPGVLTSAPPSPDLWFAPATEVNLTATAQTGFNFLAWTGALAGEPNPAGVTMNAPVMAGADFEFTYGVADAIVDLVATLPVNLQLQVMNGTAPVSWLVLSGTPPLGVTLGTDGRISGIALDMGPFPLTVRATDARGLQATSSLTLDVAAPAIPIARLGDAFLLGNQPLDSVQATFLDRQGNNNGAYDLGDFRAWVLANPSLPLSVDLPVAKERRTVTLPVWLGEPEEER